MVRRRPVAALIAMPLLLGCAAGGFIGSMMQAAEDQMLIEKLAEYDDLADHSVAVVIDTDVHQGNGTASIFADDPRTFTFSMHGARNYPWVKPASSLDVDFRDGTGDEEYMDALVDKLEKAYRLSSPELVFYLAGVDPVAGDRFGRLALTSAGLRKREHYVLETARRHGTPLAFLPAGGYAKTSLETAELHAAIHRERKSVFG